MKLQKIKKHSGSKANSGFTLIEALVAISILAISIAGPITIASKGLSSAFFARDQITAFYLAQEAVEFVRNKRDENNIIGSNWLAGLGKCKNPSLCTVDAEDSNIGNCPGDICPALEYNSDTGFYGYDNGGSESVFTREIIIDEIVNDVEASITVTLSWKTGINQKTFVVKENIFNW